MSLLTKAGGVIFHLASLRLASLLVFGGEQQLASSSAN